MAVNSVLCVCSLFLHSVVSFAAVGVEVSREKTTFVLVWCKCLCVLPDSVHVCEWTCSKQTVQMLLKNFSFHFHSGFALRSYYYYSCSPHFSILFWFRASSWLYLDFTFSFDIACDRAMIKTQLQILGFFLVLSFLRLAMKRRAKTTKRDENRRWSFARMCLCLCVVIVIAWLDFYAKKETISSFFYRLRFFVASSLLFCLHDFLLIVIFVLILTNFFPSLTTFHLLLLWFLMRFPPVRFAFLCFSFAFDLFAVDEHYKRRHKMTQIFGVCGLHEKSTKWKTIQSLWLSIQFSFRLVRSLSTENCIDSVCMQLISPQDKNVLLFVEEKKNERWNEARKKVFVAEIRYTNRTMLSSIFERKKCCFESIKMERIQSFEFAVSCRFLVKMKFRHEKWLSFYSMFIFVVIGMTCVQEKCSFPAASKSEMLSVSLVRSEA